MQNREAEERKSERKGGRGGKTGLLMPEGIDGRLRDGVLGR